MNLEFRKAENKDVESIISISRYTIDKCYRKWLTAEAVEQYLEKDSLNNYLAQNINYTWLVAQDSKILGLAICIENMIDYILVHADHQNNGVGLKLLAYCENTLFSGYSIIAIENFELNSSPLEYFKTHGWTYTNKYFDPKFNQTKMIYKKNLNNSCVYKY